MAARRASGATAANEDDVVLKLGRDELVIRHRYETLSILNDVLIAIWFLVGSICFLYPSLKEVGAWIFIIGSGQFMVRPALRLAHRFQLQRFPSSRWDL
jgi:hypothetical protein